MIYCFRSKSNTENETLIYYDNFHNTEKDFILPESIVVCFTRKIMCYFSSLKAVWLLLIANTHLVFKLLCIVVSMAIKPHLLICIKVSI